MFTRRRFLSIGMFSTLMGSFIGKSCANDGLSGNLMKERKIPLPFALATWNNQDATQKAFDVLEKGGRALDAVEQGVKIVEADPMDQSVGYGGRPDRDGNVTLDACIMDDKGNCGSVCCLQHIMHPISVARKVMEETPHVILAGEGALRFALEQGFEKENLLTETSKKEWLKWKKESKYQPIINIENHDTIGMLAIDKAGNISGACTTSGLAYKMAGRVGDSPIIGAGLFIDNEIGGAVATGLGEAVLKTLGAFLIVELMRQGKSPQQACEEAIHRITGKMDAKDFQIGFIALNKEGVIGSYSIHSGFSYALSKSSESNHYESAFLMK